MAHSLVPSQMLDGFQAPTGNESGPGGNGPGRTSFCPSDGGHIYDSLRGLQLAISAQQLRSCSSIVHIHTHTNTRTHTHTHTGFRVGVHVRPWGEHRAKHWRADCRATQRGRNNGGSFFEGGGLFCRVGDWIDRGPSKGLDIGVWDGTGADQGPMAGTEGRGLSEVRTGLV